MLGEGATIWIDRCWDDWVADGHSSTDVDSAASGRAYRHWRLAETQALSPDPDDVTRGAVMQRLWNTVNSRVRLLHELYELRTLSRVLGWESDKPNLLEILTRLGLIRPLALRQIQSIRNSVEHADRGAPPLEQCLSFLDIVWYFLRSTDLFVSRVIRDFTLSCEDSPADGVWVEFRLAERAWLPEVRGWLPRDAVHESAADAALPVVLNAAPRYEDDKIYIHGAVREGSPALADVIRRYFLVDLPDHGR